MDRVDYLFIQQLLGMHAVGASVAAVQSVYRHFKLPAPSDSLVLEPQHHDAEAQRHLAARLEENGFPHSAALLRDLADKRGLPLSVQDAFLQLQRRINHELEQVVFLRVDPARVGFFEGRERFGDEVEAAFPSARYDMEEAAKCFALNRYTASVLHLNRVLEVGLDALKTRTGIATYSPTWNAALAQIEKATTAKPEKDKTPDERAEDSFIRDAAHFLDRVKRAVRNPSVHKVERIYTDESAKEVYIAVRAFMRHLATKLSE